VLEEGVFFSRWQCHLAQNRRQETEGRGQKTEDGKQKADKVKSKNAKLQIKKSKSEYRKVGRYADTDTKYKVCKTSAARGQAGLCNEPPLAGYNAGRC